VLRPSETISMHVGPFGANPEITSHSVHTNASLSADIEEAICQPDEPICVPPVTGPANRTPQGLRTWIAEQQEQDAEKQRIYNARVAQATALYPSLHPRDLFVDPTSWGRICTWFKAYSRQLQLAENNPGHRFDFNELEGGRTGLHIPPEGIKPELRGVQWHIESENGPCSPAEWVHPQLNTELDLPAIWKYVVESWDTEDPFPDIDIVYQLCHRGLSNNSTFETGVSLHPNYEKLYEWSSFVREKTKQKLTEFDIPRLLGPFDFCPAVPMCLLPRNIATEQLDAEGNVKPRQTVNPGAGTKPFKGTKAPDSINGLTDTSDKGKFPSLEYFALRQLSVAVGILLTAGIPLAQGATDMESWYEQLPRAFFDTFLQMQMTTSFRIYRDPRLVFGFVSECHTSQRVSFLLRWAGGREVRKVQRHIEGNTVKAALVPEQATLYSSIRRAMGGTGDWFELGFFFDDCQHACFDFFATSVRRGLQTVWDLFNVSVADGRQLARRLVKNKTEDADQYQPLIMLGLQQVISPPGRRTVPLDKRQRYSDAGFDLCKEATASPVPWKRRRLDRWTSQMGFAASVDPIMRADLQQLRSTLGSAHGAGVRPTDRSIQAIKALSERIKVQSGVALLPTRAPMDSSVRPVVHVYTDAARDLTRPDSGYGILFFEQRSRVVMYQRGPWTRHEQKFLQSTSLELHSMNMALQIVAEWIEPWWPRPPPNPHGVGPHVWFDVHSVVDNSAAGDAIGNSQRASQAAERQLSQQRAHWLQANQVRVMSAHSIRETRFVEAADDLSKADMKSFGQKMRSLLGSDVTLVEMPPPRQGARSLEPALRAQKYSHR
jgi:hypothetical protein